MNPNINNGQFGATHFDGIDLDEWGSGPDLRGKVMWGLADGSLPVYSSDWENEEDGWGTECSRCGPRTNTETLLVGDDPEHTLEGTPLCQKHYREEHGHETPHYIIHPNDLVNSRQRYVPSVGEAGAVPRIIQAVTPHHHPFHNEEAKGRRPLPSRSYHGSTQRLSVGDIIAPAHSASLVGELARRVGDPPVAYSTLDLNSAMSYALGNEGNSRGRGPVSAIYEVEPVDPEETGTDLVRKSATSGGITSKSGFRVTDVVATVPNLMANQQRSLKGLQEQVRARRAALEQGAQEGRS